MDFFLFLRFPNLSSGSGSVVLKLPSKERKRPDSKQRGQKRIIVENDHTIIVDHKFPQIAEISNLQLSPAWFILEWTNHNAPSFQLTNISPVTTSLSTSFHFTRVIPYLYGIFSIYLSILTSLPSFIKGAEMYMSYTCYPINK